MTAKELKKLVKTCRELGVKTYKGPDFEFTLNDYVPEKPTNKKAQVNKEVSAVGPDFETDSLTPEEALFWSAQGGIPFAFNQEGNE